jgi:hypothetical protein
MTVVLGKKGLLTAFSKGTSKPVGFWKWFIMVHYIEKGVVIVPAGTKGGVFRVIPWRPENLTKIHIWVKKRTRFL